MSAPAIPYREVETLFLDAGNTIVGMDLAWIGALLAEYGVAADFDEIARAEARARPRVSRWLLEGGTTESPESFRVYVRSLLEGLAAAPARLESLCDSLVARLRQPGVTMRLWSRVLPGVPEALKALRSSGLHLVVVSNSDGTVEQSLSKLRLRPLVDEVVDSHIVGFQKPDPRIFTTALARSGAAAERTLHVGDLYAVDVRGARAAGLHALLLDPYGDWDGVDCERATDLGELAARMSAMSALTETEF